MPQSAQRAASVLASLLRCAVGFAVIALFGT
jgi:hypothetical protein